jgi:MoaA/NifB/PqqE/SkfB family radical SAM enzyme
MSRVLAEYLEALQHDREPEARAQEEGAITVYPAVQRRDAHIRFDQGTETILRRFRGVTPYPGAYTDVCGAEFDIEAITTEGRVAYDDQPGRVLSLEAERGEIVVKSMDGTLRLKLKDGLRRLDAIAHRNAGVWQFAGKMSPFSARDMAAGAKFDVAMPDAGELEKYLEFPDMVVVSVAYPCNAHCPNCPYTPGNSELRLKYGDAPYIPPELFEKIADECGEAGRRGWLPGGVGSMIRITGGGEPMLHPAGMTNLIEYAKRAGARVYLNSNGSMFRGDDLDRLLACNVDNVEISVDAGDEATYAVVRKGLDWKVLLENLRYLIDRRNRIGSRTTIEVSVINQQLVAGRIAQIERFWYDFGVDNVIVRKFLTWGSNTNLDPDESADPIAYLDREAGLPCPYPFHRLNIDTRGKVEVCGFDIMGRTNMGNVREQSIRAIWKGAMFTWWREKHRRGEGGDIPLCAECPDWKYRSWEHNYRKALRDAQARRERAVAEFA